MFRNTTFTQQLEKMHVVTKVKEACSKNELKRREKKITNTNYCRP